MQESVKVLQLGAEVRRLKKEVEAMLRNVDGEVKRLETVVGWMALGMVVMLLAIVWLVVIVKGQG